MDFAVIKIDESTKTVYLNSHLSSLALADAQQYFNSRGYSIVLVLTD